MTNRRGFLGRIVAGLLGSAVAAKTVVDNKAIEKDIVYFDTPTEEYFNGPMTISLHDYNGNQILSGKKIIDGTWEYKRYE